MRAFFSSCATVLLSACASINAQADSKAVIIAPTAASRAELLGAVRQMLHSDQIVLADDALTNDSTLIVDRALRRDATGQQINGRDIGRPERFTLVERGKRCLLIHERTQQQQTLRGTHCVPHK
jgi:hypothetical protein